jgi:hypothetical protein
MALAGNDLPGREICTDSTKALMIRQIVLAFLRLGDNFVGDCRIGSSL